MIVFLNGKFVPEEQATISVFDRSFLYGDGLFESLRVTRGKPFRWWDHMERLRKGGDFLGIKIPFACKSLEKFAAELIAKNQMPIDGARWEKIYRGGSTMSFSRREFLKTSAAAGSMVAIGASSTGRCEMASPGSAMRKALTQRISG